MAVPYRTASSYGISGTNESKGKQFCHTFAVFTCNRVFDFINSINSFHLNIPSPHYIDLLETSTIVEVSRDAISMLTEKHHCFEKLGRIAVTKTMLQLQQRIASIQFESALQKYESLLTMRPDITQRVPLTHIASYLGITLETLSRIRNPKNRI